ncbi:MAG TPA: hypothetical protein VNG93_12405 [Candidatus Dormibacteraeota bacterium]|nr:hypothetical protein [Candidatus Dormibacteraeota bacterium]
MLLAGAALAAALIPGVTVGAITVPLPLPTVSATPALTLPASPAIALTTVSGTSTTGTSGGSGATGGVAGGAAPALPASGADVLAGLRDPNLLDPGATPPPGDSSASSQVPTTTAA